MDFMELRIAVEKRTGNAGVNFLQVVLNVKISTIVYVRMSLIFFEFGI